MKNIKFINFKQMMTKNFKSLEKCKYLPNFLLMVLLLVIKAQIGQFILFIKKLINIIL
jgi:hypothetical protein